MIIEIIVLLGSVIDLSLTYNYLKIYKDKFPDKNYIVIEANPSVRFFIRQFGLKDGVFYSALPILFILALLLYYLPSSGDWFLAGAYYMMITFHLTNFLALKRMKREEKTNGKTKENTKGS